METEWDQEKMAKKKFFCDCNYHKISVLFVLENEQ
jgi:hypothetical protein